MWPMCLILTITLTFEIWGQTWPWPLTTHMTLAMDFHGQISKWLYLRMGGPIDIAQWGWQFVIHDHDMPIWWPRSGVWIYQIVTGVTSIVGVPSTHLVSFTEIWLCALFRVFVRFASSRLYSSAHGTLFTDRMDVLPQNLLKFRRHDISVLELTNRTWSWQASWHFRYRRACPIAERYDHYNTQYCVFESSWGSAIRCLTV